MTESVVSHFESLVEAERPDVPSVRFAMDSGPFKGAKSVPLALVHSG